MENGQTFRINQPAVVHEVMDGEVVIVNLDNGFYYSLSASGVEIWEGIDRGDSLAGILARIKQTFDGEDEVVAQSVTALIKELQEEGLVSPASSAPEEQQQNASPTEDPKPFVAPVLEKYTDLEELLLVDPIHEVDETGWPNTKPKQ